MKDIESRLRNTFAFQFVREQSLWIPVCCCFSSTYYVHEQSLQIPLFTLRGISSTSLYNMQFVHEE